MTAAAACVPPCKPSTSVPPNNAACFTKLRNIWDALQFPDDLPAPERRRQRRTIFRDFVAIFQPQHRHTILRRALHVVQKYRLSQPKAVAALRRDFSATIAYFTVWNPSHLGALLSAHHQSLERFNRGIRRPYPLCQCLSL